MRHALALLLLVACDNAPREGIAVGNPPGMAGVSLQAAQAEVTFTAGALTVESVEVEPCDGGDDVVVSRDRTLLLDDGSEPLVPAGTWCGLRLVSGAPAVLAAQAGNGGSFRFEAELDAIDLDGELTVPEAGEDEDEETVTLELVLELGDPDWLTVDGLELRPDEHVDVGQDCDADPVCTRIRTGIETRSAVYEDLDRNGRVDDSERDRGASVEGTESERDLERG